MCPCTFETLTLTPNQPVPFIYIRIKLCVYGYYLNLAFCGIMCIWQIFRHIKWRHLTAANWTIVPPPPGGRSRISTDVERLVNTYRPAIVSPSNERLRTWPVRHLAAVLAFRRTSKDLSTPTGQLLWRHLTTANWTIGRVATWRPSSHFGGLWRTC